MSNSNQTKTEEIVLEQNKIQAEESKTQKETETLINSEINSETLAEMFKAGIHLGHKKSKFHPMMDPFILTTKNEIKIINIEKTAEKIKEAINFLKNILKKEGIILFVGTAMPAPLIIKNAAESLKMPYVVNRWLGGTLTNFNTFLKRINYFLNLERKKESGELEKYTKKERVIFDKEIENLNKKFEGLKNIAKLPNALFIVNVNAHRSAIREAVKMKIPVVAICDTDSDPRGVSYLIPANDSSVSSVKYIVEKILNALPEEKTIENFNQ